MNRSYSLSALVDISICSVNLGVVFQYEKSCNHNSTDLVHCICSFIKDDSTFTEIKLSITIFLLVFQNCPIRAKYTYICLVNYSEQLAMKSTVQFMQVRAQSRVHATSSFLITSFTGLYQTRHIAKNIAKLFHLFICLCLPWYPHWLKQGYIYLFKFVTKLDGSYMVHEE